jgi:Cu-Zn family superoxide dismutase
MVECKQAIRGDAQPDTRLVMAPLALSTDPVAGRGQWWRHARAVCVASAVSAVLGGCGVFGAHPIRADATLRPTPGHTAHGNVALTQRAEGVQVTYDIVGLAPNTAHAFALHQGGDCGGVEASHAGARLELADIVPPGTRLTQQRDSSVPDLDRGGAALTDHDDALTRIWADATGSAVGFFVLPGMSLDGLRSIVGRTLVVHVGFVDRASVAAKQAADSAAARKNDQQAGKSATKGKPGTKAKPGRRPVEVSGETPDSVHLRWPTPAGGDPAGGALACGIVNR